MLGGEEGSVCEVIVDGMHVIDQSDKAGAVLQVSYGCDLFTYEC